jgi:hypothetical protein
VHEENGAYPYHGVLCGLKRKGISSIWNDINES